MKPLTEDQKTYILANYTTQGNAEMAAHLECTVSQVRHIGEVNKLHKTPETIAKVNAGNRAEKTKARRRVKVDGVGTPLATIYKPLKTPKAEKATLSDYLRPLPHSHPDMQKYLRLTKPGTPAGSAPRTLTELRAR